MRGQCRLSQYGPTSASVCGGTGGGTGSIDLESKRKNSNLWRSPAPGGATGLQIRVGPSDGLRWVRLPSSSAKSLRGRLMMPPAQGLLATFEAAADAAGKAEAAVRRRVEAEVAAAVRERAFAYRRLNLVRIM